MTTSSQKKDELKLKDKSNINNVIGNYQSYPLPLGSLDDYRIISDWGQRIIEPQQVIPICMGTIQILPNGWCLINWV